MSNNLAFFTVVARNYLAQAYVLGRSIKQFHPDSIFHIFLVDDVNRAHKVEIEGQGFSIIYPEDVKIPTYQKLVFKYNVIEASTAVKPLITKFLLDAGEQKVVYVDPDMLCFRQLIELHELLDAYSIIITPHSLSPIDDDYLINDRLFLWSGAYNLGFLAVSNTKITYDFLDWWNKRLEKYCILSSELNLGVDQKWIDLVPSFFENVLILKNPAYNFAYWNIHERTIEKIDSHWHVKDSGKALALVHFSSFDVNHPELISKSLLSKSVINSNSLKKSFSSENRPDLTEICCKYAEMLISAEYKRFISIPYGFSNYGNGERISDLERILYLSSSVWQEKYQNPFEIGKGSFHEACRGAGIKAEKNSMPKQSISSLKQSYGKASIITHLIIRIMIRVLGVERYSLLAKYIVKQFSLYNHSFLINIK
jgi:hypothetical protein